MKIRLLLSLSLLPLSVHAQSLSQRTVRFSSTTVTNAAGVTPVLTWCSEMAIPTAPAPEPTTCATQAFKPAVDCDATGPANWAGKKGAAGTLTLPVLTTNATYSLSCNWPDDHDIQSNWANPTTNANNTPLTDLDSIVLKFRQGAGTLDTATACTAPVICKTVKPPVSPATFTGFALGVWREAAFALNTAQQVSVPSNETTVTLAPAGSVARNVSITVNVPNAPTGLSAQ